jgi:hypothetical protein
LLESIDDEDDGDSLERRPADEAHTDAGGASDIECGDESYIGLQRLSHV